MEFCKNVRKTEKNQALSSLVYGDTFTVTPDPEKGVFIVDLNGDPLCLVPTEIEHEYFCGAGDWCGTGGLLDKDEMLVYNVNRHCVTLKF